MIISAKIVCLQQANLRQETWPNYIIVLIITAKITTTETTSAKKNNTQADHGFD